MNEVLVVGTERAGVDSTLGVRLPAYAAPAFAKLRGGTTALVVGGAGGGLMYFERLGHPK